MIKKESKWNEEIIIKELKIIITNIGHFPTHSELIIKRRGDLSHAIYNFGGINKFRIILKNPIIKQTHGYWKEKNIIKELKLIIKKLNYFPSRHDLMLLKKSYLIGAINRNGGFFKFRTLLCCDFIRKPKNYWNDKTITTEFKKIISEIGHFPTRYELYIKKRTDLIGEVFLHGGIRKFKELCGYTLSMQEEYIQNSASYYNTRGMKTEKIIKEILKDYCFLHNFSEPFYNKKLCKGNVLEFVCNTNKIIGIDVTNTKTSHCISNKYIKKQYHNYLDELWIVVFSNTFTEQDYIKWNTESPVNVKVMSIYTFLKELDYSLDELTKTKIDKYNECTFHTKEQLKEIK